LEAKLKIVTRNSTGREKIADPGKKLGNGTTKGKKKKNGCVV